MPYDIKIDFSVGSAIFTVIGAVFLIVAIFWLKMAIRKFRRRSDLHGLDRKGIRKKWGEIEEMLKQNNETGLKLAVIEADKLFDHVLKFMGFGGSSLGERLKLACYKFEKLRSVWWPHKIRNRIVHEADYRLDCRTAKKAIGFFREGLVELGIL